MSEVKLLGTGASVPEKIVTNHDLARLVETSDEWIRTRTGICRRHIVTGESLTSMSVDAAKKALDASGLSPLNLDMIIVATLTPDEPLPNASSAVQKALGAVNAFCFDLSAACSGFVYALGCGAMYIKGGAAKHVLVIGAEILSKIVNWEDRTTCILFGDGAGAAVLGPSEEPGFLGMSMGTDGSRGHTLKMFERDIDNPFMTDAQRAAANMEADADGNLRPKSRYVYMDGSEVFKFAVKKVPESIQQVLKEQQVTVEDVDHFVLHQANYRIIESVAKRLKASMDKFIITIDEYGNTSAASVPLALDELMHSGKVKKGELIMISGFGGGLTWGSILMRIV
ncbi:MAG TPA: ketoacyl-ACP synthase III [Candidatus Scybalocola faecigallinarum]|uniref:Beta-ketoacyl-[acyl-carrier-protein] synthase III n=1 Tax=Candidatus Scybalocola faecigallinarum TaxID=2840941 RepID=A0A9D1JRX2_9FIRM|nr:ketoacyl-ACP synthase III [Candidatus Scybalocola faecigallinarum]